MKKAAIYLFLLSVILASRKTVAQTPLLPTGPLDTFEFSVFINASTAQPPTVTTYPNGTKHVVFASQPTLNNILAQYVILKFELEFPSSRRPYLHNYWLVKAVNGYALMNALVGFSGSMFKQAHANLRPIFTYTPNDFPGQAVWGQQMDLQAIKAQQAWDITHGSPDVVVGITDTHFQLDHPDLIGKIDTVRYNGPAGPNSASDHGTTVAGAIAGGTDNHAGIASIGFNTRLDVSSAAGSDDALMKMSKDRKILNGSWYIGCLSDIISSDYYATSIMAYDEIYENGAIAIFAAGNGLDTTNPNPQLHYNDCNYLEVYPAAFPHNISVSGVGYDTVSTSIYNIKDVHEKYPGTMVQVTNHNPGVDIVAPAYDLQVIYGNSFDPTVPLYGRIDGTSHATPLVSGTVALMQAVSHDQCLSPYQMEYLLKKTADATLYSDPRNAAYIGKLGAGRLDAFKAVSEANYVSGPQGYNPCNDPATQTLMIKGVDINTVCAPGNSSNNVLPQFKIILNDAGTSPFTYKWMPLNGNTATLDNYNIGNPTIISTVSGVTPIAHFYLTVTDASAIAPKVASREVRVKLKTANTYDLAMRDGPMDMYDEPNTMGTLDPRDKIWWGESDIWNRRVDDGLTKHQDPEYYVNNYNYLYTRVRNVGCAASPSSNMKLRLYWTLQSTGEIWEDSWKTANYVSPATNDTLPGGRELTVSPYAPLNIPVLQPGQDTVLVQEWRPGRPADYDPDVTDLSACVLARIEQSSTPPYGMAGGEFINEAVGINVVNNNNIITRNMNFVDLAPGDVVPMHFAIIENPLPVSSAFTLQFLNDRSIRRELSGDLSAVAHVRLHMKQTLYDRWVRGGQLGRYAATDSKEYTVDFDGSTTMELNNIILDARERIPYAIEFILRDDAPITDMSYLLHLQQIFEKNTEGEPITLEDDVVGGISYQVHTRPKVGQANKKIKLATGETMYQVYPNPTSDKVYISYKGEDRQVLVSVIDIMGRAILSQKKLVVGFNSKELNLSSIKPGVYIVTIADEQGKVSRFKVVKQ